MRTVENLEEREKEETRTILRGITDWEGVCNSQFYNPVDGQKTIEKMKKNLLYIWSGHGRDLRPFQLEGLEHCRINEVDDFIENEIFAGDCNGYNGFKEDRIISFSVVSIHSGARTSYKKISPNKWEIIFEGTLDPEYKSESSYLGLFLDNVKKETMIVKQVNSKFLSELKELLKEKKEEPPSPFLKTQKIGALKSCPFKRVLSELRV